MKQQTAVSRVWLGTKRLIQDLTTLDQLTGEPRTNARSLLEAQLGPETTRLALAAADGTQRVPSPRTERA